MGRIINRRKQFIYSNVYCCVPQCKSLASKDRAISFHNFPKENDPRRKKWILALRMGKAITANMKVCGKHFREKDFVLPKVPTKRPHLLKTAIPSRNLPDLSLQTKEPKSVRKITNEHESLNQKNVRMTNICEALNCKNNSSYKESHDNNVTFHPFPLNNEFLLKFWLIQMDRIDFVPDSSSRLCSEHFEEDCFYYTKNVRVLQQDAVPTKFPSKEESESSPGVSTAPLVLHIKEFNKRKQFYQELESVSDTPSQFLYSSLENQDAAVQTAISGIHTQLTPFVCSCASMDGSPASYVCKDAQIQTKMDGISALLTENSVLQNELAELRAKVNRLTFSAEAITEDNLMKSLTGFSIELLKAVFSFLYLGKQLSLYASLTPFNQFFVFLIYLRTGISQLFLSILFKTSQASISRLNNQISQAIYKKVKPIKLWPSRKRIDKRTSPVFFQNYPNCRVILECVEFQIQRPTDPKTQRLTFNPRKNTFTVKGLIGKTPSGGISYISDVWPGSLSERELFLKSGILDYLEEDDLVIADKNFDIQDILEDKGCFLTTPKFLYDRILFTGDEFEKYPGADHHRIHYDLASSKYNKYKFFEGQISKQGFDIVNEYFYIVGFFINFGNPLIYIKQHSM